MSDKPTIRLIGRPGSPEAYAIRDWAVEGAITVTLVHRYLAQG